MCAFLSAVALAGLSLAATAQAQSSAKCEVKVVAGAKSYSHDAFVQRGFDLAGYLCEDYYHPAEELSVYAQDWVHATAEAYAEAFIATLVDCKVEGNADASVYIEGHAQTNADAAAKAILEGYASVSTCNGCDVYMDVFIESSKKVFVEASVSHAEDIYLYVDGGKAEVVKDKLIQDIQHEIIDVYVHYFVELYASMTGGNSDDTSEYCFISGNACASTGEPNCCNWSAGGGSYASAMDAFADAFVSIPHDEINCKEVSDATYEDFAQAVATAYASSFASIYTSCYSDNPDGNSCVWSEVSASGFAHAAAEATAQAWIAKSYCGCKPSGDIIVDALDHIYAEAYSYLSADVCVVGTANIDVDLFVSAYDEKFGKATAKVFASVWQNKYQCEVKDLKVLACAGEAANDAPCYADYYESVKHCKSDDYHCVKINDKRAVCKHKDYEPPSAWNGEILECPEH